MNKKYFDLMVRNTFVVSEYNRLSGEDRFFYRDKMETDYPEISRAYEEAVKNPMELSEVRLSELLQGGPPQIMQLSSHPEYPQWSYFVGLSAQLESIR